MEIFSTYNNGLITKLESIDNTRKAALAEIPEIFKKNASTSCLDLTDVNSNPCNQVLVKNAIIETCYDGIATSMDPLSISVLPFQTSI
jgi:hypothetical protein